RSFESLGAFNGGGCGVERFWVGKDAPPGGSGFWQRFSPFFFDVLGVEAQNCPGVTQEGDQGGKIAAGGLFCAGLWKRRFGRDPGMLGKTITLNRTPTTVIGVLPSDFELFKDPNSTATRGSELDFVIPLELTPTQVQSKVGGLTIVGRLKGDISLQQ